MTKTCQACQNSLIVRKDTLSYINILNGTALPTSFVQIIIR